MRMTVAATGLRPKLSFKFKFKQALPRHRHPRLLPHFLDAIGGTPAST
jgi:hypothetical protein